MKISLTSLILSASLIVSTSAMANNVQINTTLADIFGDSDSSSANLEAFTIAVKNEADSTPFDTMANNIQECQYLDDKVKQSEIVLGQSDAKLKESEIKLRESEAILLQAEQRFQQAEDVVALAEKKLLMIKKSEENINIIRRALGVQ